ncbi:MAG: HEAT repeat domain-containing protein [Cyanobacteriota bacterium]|nr:HEAT repeat domain-containing protein [Cyanobacteriota bacterium]
MEASLVGLAGWGLSKIADSLWDTAWEKGGKSLTQSLNKTDIEKAIKSGEKAVKEWEKELSPQQLLFYSAKQDGWNGVNKFISQYFQNSAVLQELQKPLISQGKPDIEILITIFQQEAQTKNIQLNQQSLQPWIETFVNAYFQQTDTYIKFQVAKQNYFEQLANWFDDVKFAGISVPGQEIEKSEKLAYIFVMPDVVEDVSTGGGFERDLLLAGTGEKLERELLINTTGRKFLASELLTQSQSQKFVILGAPGSGKTTLMSYFAVMLAQSIPPTPLGKGSIPPTPLGKGGYSQENPLVQNSDRYTESSESIPPTPLGKGGYSYGNYVGEMGHRTSVPLRDRSFSPLSQEGQGGSKSQGATILGLDPNTDWLPILIRIRDLARHPDKSILEYARIFAEKTMAVKTLPTGFFEHWLEDGRALILLDGLDEVAEEGKRYDVVKRIENFLGQFDRNRAIITSRPAGYKRDFFRTEEFPHYQMQSFDDEKISAFINNWYDSRFRDKGEAERRKESLRKALDDNDRIKLLARNPLLLTIIALIHRYQAVLPKKRFELYDAAVKTLLTSWDANKEISNQEVFKYLDLDDLRRLMELLAFWVHTQGNVGDNEGGTLIDRDELIEQLSREIKTLKQVQLYQAKEEAERFVELIRERTGLLNEQGQDFYGFVHKTFQEYLCAEEIDYQADNEGDFEIVLDSIREHLHDSHWREVLLLLIAQQKPKKVAKAMRAILNCGSEYEHWLHRDLFFAGDCLAEDPKGLRSVDGELVQEILEKLLELEVSSKELVGAKVRNQVYQIFCSLHETDVETQTLEMLKERFDLIDRDRLFSYQGELGEKEEAIATLLAMLQEKDSVVRLKAIRTLRFLQYNSEALISALLKCLDDEDYNVRANTAYTLGYWGKSSYHAFNTLLDLLQNDNLAVRWEAAFIIEKLGYKRLSNTIDTVLETLPPQLQDWVFAVSNDMPNLDELNNTYQSNINALLERLQDQNPILRGGAANALGKLGNNSEIIISALLERLQDEVPDVCGIAAMALGYLSNTSQIVVNALLGKLEDDNHLVRCGIVSALGNLGDTSQTVVNALLAKLNDDSEYVRQRVSQALGKLGKKSNNILPIIIQWIQQHQDSEYVGRGIDVLWYLVVGEES